MPSAVIGALRVNLGIDTAEFRGGLAESQANLAKWAKAAERLLLLPPVLRLPVR